MVGLLNGQGLGWNEAKLESILSTSDANDIKHIVIGGPGTEDYRAWNFTKSGLFTVRSAYQLGVSMKKASRAPASSSSLVVDHRSFMQLWAADVPNKVKIHSWRMISNGLAVGMELQRRRIKQEYSA